MNKVSMDKRYKTRSGLDARIIYTGLKQKDYSVVGIITDRNGDETLGSFTLTGRYSCEEHDHCYDLIEVSPYADFKIDDKVVNIVSKCGLNYAHFAGLDDTGNPLVFAHGCTSHTTSIKVAVTSCELYKEE